MVTAIHNLYKGYASLHADEVGPKLMKVALGSLAFLALGVKTYSSLPLKPLIVTIALTDVVFYYFAQRHPERYVKARKYERLIDAGHVLALTWGIGHLFQSLAAESILRNYSTYPSVCYVWRLLSQPVEGICIATGMLAVIRLVKGFNLNNPSCDLQTHGSPASKSCDTRGALKHKARIRHSMDRFWK